MDPGSPSNRLDHAHQSCTDCSCGTNQEKLNQYIKPWRKRTIGINTMREKKSSINTMRPKTLSLVILCMT